MGVSESDNKRLNTKNIELIIKTNFTGETLKHLLFTPYILLHSRIETGVNKNSRGKKLIAIRVFCFG